MTYEEQTNEAVEETGDTDEVQNESESHLTYGGYQAHGGRIDEANYERVMRGAKEATLYRYAEVQTKITADISGISLDEIKEEVGVDPRIIYGILRNDEKPDGVEHHHSQMSDQELLVEALRMLEAGDAVNAIIAEHPHINFS